jgi:hypothetical protein
VAVRGVRYGRTELVEEEAHAGRRRLRALGAAVPRGRSQEGSLLRRNRATITP